MIDDVYMDCRVYLHGQRIRTDVEHVLPIAFLDVDFARSHLHVGKAFTLWESRTIAMGTILCVVEQRQSTSDPER